MDILFQWIIFIYFISFIAIALIYRTFRVFKETGVNALKQKPKEPVLKSLALALKIHFILVLILVVDYTFGLNILTSNRFEWLQSTTAAIIGSIMLITCLPIIVLSQVQMSSSWRIEVNKRDDANLITKGLFKYSRNPIFLAIRMAYFAMFLLVPCAYSLVVFIFGDLCFQIQVYQEEKALKQLFGKQYQQYCTQVPRWI